MLHARNTIPDILYKDCQYVIGRDSNTYDEAANIDAYMTCIKKTSLPDDINEIIRQYTRSNYPITFKEELFIMCSLIYNQCNKKNIKYMYITEYAICIYISNVRHSGIDKTVWFTREGAIGHEEEDELSFLTLQVHKPI